MVGNYRHGYVFGVFRDEPLDDPYLSYLLRILGINMQLTDLGGSIEFHEDCFIGSIFIIMLLKITTPGRIRTYDQKIKNLPL